VDSWTEELQERHNVYLEVLRLAKNLGVEFAFPTQTLHVDSMAEAGKRPTPPQSLEETQLAAAIEAFGPGGNLSRPSPPILTNGYFAGKVKKVGGDG
jgi:MscS family membrane protein